MASVPRARRYVRDLLDTAGHRQADDALLLVSELVANSVRHSDSGRHPGGRVTVAVAKHDATIRIDVIDAGSPERSPSLRAGTDPGSCTGRGLWLVDELASEWGWHDTPAGRVVWFQLAGS
ncbi:ATP-binding protein [Planomonospora corallina]|uniref:ATP-binding protein n=1 Tax=Planomonospora corallina TaxID=1806052 RepID=A0ABV8I8S3_9ACTN